MRLVLYVQYYRGRSPERQAELDHCLCSNLQHPALDQVVLLREPDAPDLPGPARMPVQIMDWPERLTYSHWMQLVRQQTDVIGILINSDIALGQGWQHIQDVLSSPELVVALSRYNTQGTELTPRLNRFPHWTQDTWAIRSDAPILESLLHASSFPIGFPGCDNRIAYVFWSHGLIVKNPCYHLETVHHQASPSRSYDKFSDRLYGGTSYVHPSLFLEEPSELEHTIWTRAKEPCTGIVVNHLAVGEGIHHMPSNEQEHSLAFQQQVKSTSLAWKNPPIGSDRSDHGSTWAIAELMTESGVLVRLGGKRVVVSLQLRLPEMIPRWWRLELRGRMRPEANWKQLDIGKTMDIQANGKRHFIENKTIQKPWRQLGLHLEPYPKSEVTHPESSFLLELLVFAKKAP